MLARIAMAVFGLLAAAGGPALADQSDERLDLLFGQLARAPDATFAHKFEAAIWQIWLEPKMVGTRIVLREGLRALAEDDYQTALHRFDAVVELEPEFAEGWNKRATVLYLMGDYDNSVEDIKRTLTLEPRHFGALSGLGIINQSLDRKKDALKAFRAALAVHPNLENIKDKVRELAREVEGTEL
jgi:tetratricopeptide (TPR) repeat protein